MRIGLVLALLAVWPSAGEGQVAQGSLRAGVRGGVALAEVVTRVGFETTVVLPRAWNVVERRLGDPNRWVVTGGGHLTMVRPLVRGAATNLALVLSDGSVVSVGLRESDLSAVHTVVHLAEAAEEGAPGEGEGLSEDVVAGTGAESPVLLSAVDVEAIREEERRALGALRAAEEDVRARVDDAVAASEEAVEDFIADYPQRLHFVFEFHPEVDVTADPYRVEGMWHDTQSTFIRFRRAAERGDRRGGVSAPGRNRTGAPARGDRRRSGDSDRRGRGGRDSRRGGSRRGRPVAHQGGGRAVAQWQLKVPAGVVPKNLPVYIALGLVAVLLLVMFLTGSGAPSDESAAGGEQAIEAAVADVRTVVEPVLREGERLREDLARLEAQRQADEEARSRQEDAARDEDLADARLELEGARAALLQAQRIRGRGRAQWAPARGGVGGHPGGARDGRGAGASGGDPAAGGRALCAVAARAGGRGRSGSGRCGSAGMAPAAPVITGDPLLDEQLLAFLRQEAAGGAPGQVPSAPAADGACRCSGGRSGPAAAGRGCGRGRPRRGAPDGGLRGRA